MYQEFSITGIEPIIKDKQIVITANKAINENNLENIVVQVYERKTKAALLFDYEVQYDKLIITLKDWPIPNTDYILGVTGITSVAEEELTSNIKTRFRFDSNVLSTVEIIEPVTFQEIQSLDIKLSEKADTTDKLVGIYYLEVATDNAFYNVTNKVSIDKNTLTLILKTNGQYFIRARVQADDSNYSEWSPVISFIYGNKYIENNSGTTEDNHGSVDIEVDLGEDDFPEIDLSDPFVITEYPDQGLTPESSLLIAFNNHIDSLSLDNITIIRKDVR